MFQAPGPDDGHAWSIPDDEEVLAQVISYEEVLDSALERRAAGGLIFMVE